MYIVRHRRFISETTVFGKRKPVFMAEKPRLSPNLWFRQ
jgi:hypothetical protein